jgi:heptosyltransferase III
MTNRKIERKIIACCTGSKQFLKKPLDKNEPIAFLLSSRLGDTLISLVSVNNLLQNGYEVDIYGDYAYALRDWFPYTDHIHPLLNISKEDRLSKYPIVFHMDENPLSKSLAAWHPNSFILWQRPLYRAPMPMVDIQVFLCKQHFGLKNVTRSNGIKPVSNLVQKKFRNRIILHPTSSKPLKNWRGERFLKLAHLLKDKGYDPHFIVLPEEKPYWEEITKGLIPTLASTSLSEIAALLYESGYFIGNDSGIGHLASNLGVPTVSLIVRPGTARQWRPSWAPGEIVLPPAWLNPRQIKELFWKYFISTRSVIKAFERLKNAAPF